MVVQYVIEAGFAGHIQYFIVAYPGFGLLMGKN